MASLQKVNMLEAFKIQWSNKIYQYAGLGYTVLSNLQQTISIFICSGWIVLLSLEFSSYQLFNTNFVLLHLLISLSFFLNAFFRLNSCNEKKLFLPTPQVMKDVVMASSSRTRYPVVLLNLSLNKTYSSEGCVEVVSKTR